ncbi:zinc-dependent metalloprotease [Candidatus Riflebacteria bacterium]
MRTITLNWNLLLITLALLCSSGSHQLNGGAFTINPTLNVNNSGIVTPKPPPDFDGTADHFKNAKRLSLSAEFLKKKFLFGAMVEASTFDEFIPGMGAYPQLVEFQIQGKSLVLVAIDPLKKKGPGVPIDIINRYPIVRKLQQGKKYLIDFSKPEIKNGELVFGSSSFMVTSDNQLYDVDREDNYLSFGEVYILRPQGEAAFEYPGRITVAIKYYFKELVKSRYKPKVYSDKDFNRFGSFRTHRHIKNSNGVYKKIALARRWRIPEDGSKITYYLHPSIPEEFRNICREGVLCWNKVFQDVLGIEPFAVEDGKAEWLPADVTKNVIYWVDYPVEFGAAAVGPSAANPLTGEIFDGDIIIYGGSLRQTYEMESPENVRARIKPPKAGEFSITFGGGNLNKFSLSCGNNIYENGLRLSELEQIETGKAQNQEFLEYIAQTIPHEVGHTIGLRHNFKGSADLENIEDGKHTTTVMEYNPGNTGLSRPGPYDIAAIAYIYNGVSSYYEGKNLLFGSDEMQTTDPEVNTFDLGDPLVHFTNYFARLKMARDRLTLPDDTYLAIVLDTLKNIRLYVNHQYPAKGQKAFTYLLTQLGDRSGTEKGKSPFNVMERCAILASLNPFESKKTKQWYRATVNSYFKKAPRVPLNEEQTGILMQTLKQLLIDIRTPDSMQFRLAALDLFKGANNMEALSIIKEIKEVVEKNLTDFSGNQKEKFQLQELGMRLGIIIEDYFRE